MIRHELICHPSTPPRTVQYVGVSLERTATSLKLMYIVEGPTEALKMPVPQKPYRTDGLWQTTCFELFYRNARPGYLEFNFSPSSQWAAYRFADYRSDGEPLDVDEPPACILSDEGYALLYTVSLGAIGPAPMAINLTAVIEETDGTKSYWALAHPDGPPDFHDPACFVLELPAAG